MNGFNSHDVWNAWNECNNDNDDDNSINMQYFATLQKKMQAMQQNAQYKAFRNHSIYKIM